MWDIQLFKLNFDEQETKAVADVVSDGWLSMGDKIVEFEDSFAKLLGDRKGLEALKGIMMTHKALGHMPDGLMRTRNQIYDNLMRQSSSKYSNHKDVISSF